MPLPALPCGHFPPPNSPKPSKNRQRYRCVYPAASIEILGKPMVTGGEICPDSEKGLLWQMQKPFRNHPALRSDGIMQWNGSAWTNPTKAKVGQSPANQDSSSTCSAATLQGLEKAIQPRPLGTEKQLDAALTPKTAVTP